MNNSFLLVAVYDRVSGNYGSPTIAINKATAIRDAKQNLRTSAIIEDLELYVVGGYDIRTADIVPCKPDLIYKFADDNGVIENENA